MIKLGGNSVFVVINAEKIAPVFVPPDSVAGIGDIGHNRRSAVGIFFKIVPEKARFHPHIEARKARNRHFKSFFEKRRIDFLRERNRYPENI